MMDKTNKTYWACLWEAERKHNGPLVSDKSKLEMCGLDIDKEMARIVAITYVRKH